jgi:septum formation protein
MSEPTEWLRVGGKGASYNPIMQRLRLVLASGSPRRRQLLESLGIDFEVHPARVDETPLPGESDVDFVVRVAREKGADVASRFPDVVVLSADTIVSIDGEILGKPRDRNDAVRMLERLAGRQHSVYTAVFTLHSPTGARHEGIERTRVWFNPLDRPTIEDYVDREDVIDKAGAYAIQGVASAFIPRIEGNYPNVVGLPLPLTCSLLKRHGFDCNWGGSPVPESPIPAGESDSRS